VSSVKNINLFKNITLGGSSPLYPKGKKQCHTLIMYGASVRRRLLQLPQLVVRQHRVSSSARRPMQFSCLIPARPHRPVAADMPSSMLVQLPCPRLRALCCHRTLFRSWVFTRPACFSDLQRRRDVLALHHRAHRLADARLPMDAGFDAR
jgi:hypothetical protein